MVKFTKIDEILICVNALYLETHDLLQRKVRTWHTGYQWQNRSSFIKTKYCYNVSNIDLVVFVILSN